MSKAYEASVFLLKLTAAAGTEHLGAKTKMHLPVLSSFSGL